MSSGDAFENSLAETIIGLNKTEVIHHGGPWRSSDDVEYATLEWVAWFNTTRFLAPLGYIPPAKYEAHFYSATASDPAEPQITESPEYPGRFTSLHRR
ncbi:MAG: transposase [Polaromonas sp.]|nr:transposase [Gemmatimonadaceae bacterium]